MVVVAPSFLFIHFLKDGVYSGSHATRPTMERRIVVFFVWSGLSLGTACVRRVWNAPGSSPSISVPIVGSVLALILLGIRLDPPLPPHHVHLRCILSPGHGVGLSLDWTFPYILYPCVPARFPSNRDSFGLDWKLFSGSIGRWVRMGWDRKGGRKGSQGSHPCEVNSRLTVERGAGWEARAVVRRGSTPSTPGD